PGVVRIVATDANSVSTWKEMSIDVIDAPQPAPRLDPYGASFTDCTIGWPCELGISVFSGGTAITGGAVGFTATVSGQPAGMGIRFRDDYRARDVLVAGVPTQTGDFDITVTVTDALDVSTTNTFRVHVSPLLQRFDSFRRLDLVNGQ